MKTRRIQIVATGVVVLGTGLAAWLFVGRTAPMLIPGTDADAALPQAEAAAEFILPAALETAREEALRRDARALVVHRHGHRVFAGFTSGRTGEARIDGGELGAAVLELALHEPGQAAQLDAAGAARLVSERLWLPLRAGDASLSDWDGAAARRCCISARLDDWMRVGDLLLGQGAYQGERFLSADAVRQLLAARAAPPVAGDEPLLARDGTAFDLAPGVRLWLMPRRQLAILVWADAGVARDTLLPNIILRGLDDPSPAIGGGISDIVPGH